MPNRIFSFISLAVQRGQRFFSGLFWQRVVFALLGILGVGLFFALFYFAGLTKVYGILAGLAWWQLFSVIGFVFITFTIAAWRWQIILRGFGYRPSFVTLTRIIFKSAAVSLLVPSFEISGETFKALRLKRHEVSAPASFASVFFDYFTTLVVTLLLSSVLVIYIVFQGFYKAVWAIAFALGVLMILYFLLRKFFNKGWFTSFIIKCLPVSEKTVEEVGMFDYGVSFFLKESRRFFVFSALLSALGFIWEVMQVSLILGFLGVPSSFLIVAWFYLSIYFFNGVPVFGGFGFGEVGAFVSGSFLGASPETSLALALLLRSRQLIALVVGGGLFIFHELKELRNNHTQLNGQAMQPGTEAK